MLNLLNQYWIRLLTLSGGKGEVFLSSVGNGGDRIQAVRSATMSHNIVLVEIKEPSVCFFLQLCSRIILQVSDGDACSCRLTRPSVKLPATRPLVDGEFVCRCAFSTASVYDARGPLPVSSQFLAGLLR